MANEPAVFNIEEFLEQYGTSFDDGKFRGEVLQFQIKGGVGVFAGQNSKFFPVVAQKLAPMVKKQADDYAKNLEKATVTGCVQQTWFQPIINKEKQPTWNEGKWEEMKRVINHQVDGEWVPTGDWMLFSSQWAGDNAPIKPGHWNKKLWCHAEYRKHPDFDPQAPDQYTARVKDGVFELDENGKPMPRYIRVVVEVIGDTREEAEAWYAAHSDGSSETAVASKSIEDSLKELRQFVKESDDNVAMECLQFAYTTLAEGTADDDFVGTCETIGIDAELIEKLKTLVG